MKTLILLNSKDEPVQEFVSVKSYNDLKTLYGFFLDKVAWFLESAPYSGTAYYIDEDRFRDFQRLCQQLRLSFLNRESSDDDDDSMQ